MPFTIQPLSRLSDSPMLFRAVSRAALSLGAEVLMMVDQRAFGGRLYVPSVKDGSSKNAFCISGNSGSSPCLMSFSLSFATPSSNFSPIKRKNIRVSMRSLFSKKDPELGALRRISRHLNNISSKFSVSSLFFLAMPTSQMQVYQSCNLQNKNQRHAVLKLQM